MSASSVTATNIFHSEKRTLGAFLGLYTFLTLLILALASAIYYNLQKDLELQKQRLELEPYAKELIDALKILHIHFDVYRTYPRNPKYRSAIYDADRTLIFSTLHNPQVDFDRVIEFQGDTIHYNRVLDSYYLGAKYVVLEVDSGGRWILKTWQTIVLYGLTFLGVMLFSGLFLVRLFLQPLRSALHLLDRFIKDTTHELNTPVAAILTNIETIDAKALPEKTNKKIRRIEIAAKTISTIYQDLTYLVLRRQSASHNQEVDLAALVRERMEYFSILAEPKAITLQKELQADVTLFIDPIKAARLVDNLLSNAIKYNRRGGWVQVRLRRGEMVIEDSGRGIDEAAINHIFERYSRFDTSAGGFGIGLNIVAMLVKEYHLDISVESRPEYGTKVTVSWPN